MSGASGQMERLLALVPYLNSHPEIHLHEVAADFEVTPQQVVRDLKVLWFCGLPGLGPGDLMEIDMEAFERNGDGVIRFGNADYFTGPQRLDRSETAALLVALRALRETADEDTVPVIERAIAKLEAAAGSVTTEVVEVVAASGYRSEIERAITDGRQLRLRYYVPSRDEETERDVDPIAVVEADGTYLDAYCHLTESRRLFRLDRIRDLTVTDAAVTRTDYPPRDLGQGFFGDDSGTATIRLQRPARWIAEYLELVAQQELPDDALEVELPVGDPQWLIRQVVRLAPYAEVVRPESLAARVRSAAEAALAAYTGDSRAAG